MTQFKDIPLFGNDSSPSHTSFVISLISTIVFWILFFICAIVIKPKEPKPKYKEVQIVLAPMPEVPKQKEEPAPAAAAPAAPSLPQESAQTEPSSAPAAPKATVEQPKQSQPAKPKAEPKKAETKPASAAKPKTETKKQAQTAPTAPVLAEDPMEAFNRQTAQKKSQNVDWDAMFADDTVEDTPSPSAAPIKPAQSSFSGSAGTTSNSTQNTKQSSTSISSTSNNKSSSNTTAALGKIADTTFTGKAVSGVKSQSNVQASVSGSGRVVMEMADGTQRTLINPKEPGIDLSDKAASTIDGSRTVTIEFFVNEQGYVPYSDIEISPASLLSEIVCNEIRAQISKWQFEPASFSSIARFEYKIIKQ